MAMSKAQVITQINSLRAQGFQWDYIRKKIGDMGYVGERSKKPLSVNGLKELYFSRKKSRKKPPKSRCSVWSEIMAIAKLHVSDEIKLSIVKKIIR